MRKQLNQYPAQLVLETPLEDTVLIRAAKAGDVAACEELIRRYDVRLLRIVQYLTGNRNDAEPIVQEVFVTAFEELDRFQDSQFWTWLIRITLDQPLMKLPDEQAEEEWFHDHHSLSEAKHHAVNVMDWAPNVEELYRPTELAGILRRALQELSPGLRRIFVLRDIAGLSLEQTAEATGLSLHAVKIRSMKGRLHLRDGLSNWFHQE